MERGYESNELLSGQVSLQNLHVTAQTIFYGFMQDDALGTGRFQSTRPHHIEAGGRRFSFNSPGTPSETGRSSPRYFSDGQTLEDLRRKLAHAGGSTSSLSSTSKQSAVQSPSPSQGAFLDETLSPTLSDEPVFQTDLKMNVRPSLQSRPRSRVSAVGVEVGRASPAKLSPDESFATGTLNIEPRANIEADSNSGKGTPPKPGSYATLDSSSGPPGHLYSTYGTFLCFSPTFAH